MGKFDSFRQVIKSCTHKMEDDWRAENLTYEKVQFTVMTKLNQAIKKNLKTNEIFGLEEIKSHQLIDCYIIDDYDYACKKIGRNHLLLNVTYKAEITTKCRYRGQKKSLAKINTYACDIHFQYELYYNRVTEEKALCINIFSE